MRYAIIAAMALGGCNATQPANAPQRATGNDTCNAAAYQDLVGQDAVVDLTIPEPKRAYRIGDPVTADYDPARVNI